MREAICLEAIVVLISGLGCSDGAGANVGSGGVGAADEGEGAGGSEQTSVGSGGTAPVPGPSGAGWTSDYRGTQSAKCSSTDEADFAGLSQVTVGKVTLYAGYEQTSGDNQDPVFARFDDGKKVYCVHQEDDGPDGRAVALTWDGQEHAYVVYTVVGGGTDLEGKGGWLSSYAPGAISGGGKKVSVVAQVSAETGNVEAASFVVAVLGDGKLNSHQPVDEELSLAPITVLADGNVQFMGSSGHKPIDADGKSPMDCSDYPFTTKYVLSPNLKELVCAESTNCVSQKPCE